MSASTQVFYPSLRYRDARAAIDWLVEALGFEVGMVVDGEGDRDFAIRDPEGNLWNFGTYGPRSATLGRAASLSR